MSTNTNPRQYNKKVLIFGFGLILLALLIAVVSDKHLSSDGANYFVLILETHTFFYSDWSRQFAANLSQLPLVLSVNAGLKDIPTLRIVFGVSILVPWLLAIGLSLFALRHEDKSIMLFMMASMVSINLTSDYILAGEHHVMVLLSWPILFFLVRRSPLEWHDAVILWGLLFIFSRLYPTALIPATIFVVIGLARILYSESTKQKTIFLGAILLSAVVIAISVYFIVNPSHFENKASFSKAIKTALWKPEAITSATFVILVFAGWLFRRYLLIWMAILPIAGFALYVMWTGHSLSAGQSFANRTLSSSLLPILMLAAIGIQWKERQADLKIATVFALFVAIMVAANLYSTWQWSQFKAQMKTVLAEKKGLVPIETTELIKSSQRWRWNNEQLSVIWSNGCVQSIIVNVKDGRWQPKGPPETFRLKDYTCYTSEFLRYDSSLCPCKTRLRRSRAYSK